MPIVHLHDVRDAEDQFFALRAVGLHPVERVDGVALGVLAVDREIQDPFGGDGDELENLKNDAKDLDNIIFKGRVPKQQVPSILSQGYASILHNKSTELDKYGHCQNKFFEYLAAGKPILLTYPEGHSVVKQYGCGVEAPRQEAQAIADAISAFCELDEADYEKYCRNTADCARMFDYGELTRQLINVINA